MQERSELESALAAVKEAAKSLIQSGRKDEGMAALQEAESLHAQIQALDSPAAAAAAAPPAIAALAPTVSTRASAKKELTPKQCKDYDAFKSRLEAQAEQAQQRAEEFKAQGQADAAAHARSNYEMDRLSLQRLAEYRANCVTKLPKTKALRAYLLRITYM